MGLETNLRLLTPNPFITEKKIQEYPNKPLEEACIDKLYYTSETNGGF